uniref:Uncharacterized protein n=1 Tax=Octopus bimaculoides TaxID=37653 RepID=A0A0L8HET6_OCTBM
MPREELRNFKRPSKINFEAQDYVDLINWEKQVITSLQFYGPLQVLIVFKARSGTLTAIPLPCHSQGVEHGINLVTKACEVRIGDENRHKLILNVRKSRQSLPHFD